MKPCLIFLSIIIGSCIHENARKSRIVPDQKQSINDTSSIPEVKSTLDGLIEQAVRENKHLFLVFGFEKCGWCKIFKNYHQDREVSEVLLPYFIISEIDYNKTPQGKELYRTYGSTGFPSWTIMDQSGKVLINCDAPVPGVKNRKYNVGYPVGKDQISWYIHCIKTAAPSISFTASELLKDKLEYYHH